MIINNLCAYIRSPFLLAERAKQLDAPYAKDLQKNFGGDIEKFNEDKQYFAQEKAALEEERQVRQSIIKEMREHLSKNYSKSGPGQILIMTSQTRISSILLTSTTVISVLQ